mgnify:FL=1
MLIRMVDLMAICLSFIMETIIILTIRFTVCLRADLLEFQTLIHNMELHQVEVEVVLPTNGGPVRVQHLIPEQKITIS